MKLRGRITDLLLLAGGRQRITIETGDDLRGEYDRLHEKEISAEIRVYRRPRSMDANAYFHLLVNRIAATLGSSDEDVKKQLVVKYGTLETDDDGIAYGAMLPASADIDRFYPYARCYKTEERNGKSYKCYLFYKRTRDMDSREMSHLIDGTVSEAKELGIETLPPDELRSMEDLWKNHQGG